MKLPWRVRRDEARSRGASPAVEEAISDAQQILDALSDPVLVLAEQRIVLANSAAEAMLGPRLAGQDVRLVLRHPHAAALIASPADGTIEFAVAGEEGRRIELRATSLPDERRLLQLFDRSARYLAERARTDFVANASHELRTPLATIRGYAETLLDDEAGGDRGLRQRFLTIMEREARRMERLIEDLMSLSRIEADKFVRPDDAVRLDRVVTQAVAELCGAHEELDGRLRLEIEAGVTVRGDAAQLSQVVHNLVDNARRYGGDGAIEVTLRQDGEAQLTVVDHGPGIEPRHVPRLTERFYRVDAARSRGSGGTGLGLAIVKHIVERHGGRLAIISTLGIGTRVEITLPVIAGGIVTPLS